MKATSEQSDDRQSSAADSGLTDRQRKVLDFERQWWKHAGAKEEAIRLEFALSAARYYQVLNAVLDNPAAVVFDPMLVKRLQRIRDARTEARSTRLLGTPPPASDN